LREYTVRVCARLITGIVNVTNIDIHSDEGINLMVKHAIIWERNNLNYSSPYEPIYLSGNYGLGQLAIIIL